LSSTGLEVSITPKNAKLQVSATSTTVSLLF
jgi:hypothetical protein